jgi:4-amino-4-deoxy-L-arabinose transferase-like glycosyltransferase
MKIKPVYILFLIIGLSIFLRFWKLGIVPVSPDWDEAALGYNAYSILKTGKDEYGTFLPRSLRSYDDYKPPLYAYLTIPSVAVFGLNVWAVRLPSAVMGVLAVIGTYYLVLELFWDYTDKTKARKEKIFSNVPRIALICAFLLAISPWHLQFSRIAFEANSGLTLNIWAIYLLLKARRFPRWIVLCAFLSALALYAYHSERIFVPLLLLITFLLWKKDLLTHKKWLMVGIVVGLITVAPLIPVVLDKTSLTRLKGTSSLSDQTGILFRSVQKLQDDKNSGNIWGLVFDNRRIVYAKTLIDGYISHFSIRWLFLTGDNDRHHAPDIGLLYLWELPFIALGMFVLFKKGGKAAKLLFLWYFIAPIAASPTSETPHAIRTLVFLPTYQIFSAFGIISFLSLITHYSLQLKKIYKYLMYGMVGILFLCITANTVYYFHMYYAHMNYEYSRFWQYGYKQAVEYAEKNKSKYAKIVVSTSLEQPHMFFLFYTQYDPERYIREGGTSSGGFAEVRNHFDKYEFRKITDWSRESHNSSILYIGPPKEVPVSSYTISYLNGEEAIRIAE